jgi:hypothetical protein
VGPGPPLIALLPLVELARSEGNRTREEHRGVGTREKNGGGGETRVEAALKRAVALWVGQRDDRSHSNYGNTGTD